VTTPIPVLLYHAVSDDPPRGSAWGAVSRAEFAAHAEVIRASDREPITITELAAGLRGEWPLPARPVAVTFDDGYEDTETAVAYLYQRGIVSTVYVTTGTLGAPGHATPDQIRAIAQLEGVEIGAHSVRHQRLDELDKQEVVDEVRRSRAQLEALIADRVWSFAYPHGAHNRRVRNEVAAAGYHSAAAVKNAISHPADDPFALARWTVMSGTSSEQLADVLEGRRVPLASSRERWRTRAYRITRRGRRRIVKARTRC
jgi:peptidoglycan/xylan/chitin deacetylase (PgdA/CDA1 family)